MDDAAFERISDYVDTSGDYNDIRTRLVKRYPKWTAHQRNRAAMGLVDRELRIQEFKEGKITKSYTQTAVFQAMSPGGTKRARYKVVKSIDGKYLGREGNIRVVTRKDKAVWAKNLRTGRIARVK